MNVNRIDTDANALGAYLRDRRARLDPAELGFTPGRRRTPGLRREEVALRANISPAWYAWLEQGRGGAPSPEVLGRVGESLMLTDAEREHMFFLAFGRPPEVTYTPPEGISPRLQRLLDAMETTPAIVIATATYDVLAWNLAATLVMIDYASLPPQERNILKLTFRPGPSPTQDEDRARIARLMVSSFRADAARSGALQDGNRLAAELCETSEEFRTLWNEHDIRVEDKATIRLYHPDLGVFQTEYSSFAVDGRSDLSMIVHHAVDPAISGRIRSLVQG